MKLTLRQALALAEPLRNARVVAGEAGLDNVVASVCGTDGDPQGLEGQERTLREAGAVVFPSNVQATAFAREIIQRRAEGG